MSRDAPETNGAPRKLNEPRLPRNSSQHPDPTSGLLPSSTNATSTPWSASAVLASLPKTQQPPTSPQTTPVAFLSLISRLKTTKREGWRRFGIAHGESIADHMYRMAIMTMLAPRSLSSRLDVPRCTRMALIHDMAEALVGDLTPMDGVAKSEKSRREAETMEYLTKDLLGGVEDSDAGAEMMAVWREYEDGETLESKFVHDVDKMELVLQMVEYEKAHEGQLDLGEFSWVAERIVLPEVRTWCAQILRDRAAFWQSLGKTASGSSLSDHREKQQQEYYGATK
ncbi:hypothetical protein MRB53_039255 [Persea americana]|nr:hypothetical protein MRB53_039255 [Persea americana]